MPKGRPKQEIEFFPHFLKDSTTIKALEMLYGNNGYACWFKLLEILGSSKEYQYSANTKEQCNKLIEKFNIDGKLLGSIINTLCDLNAIDKDKWKQERILFVPNLVHNINKIKKKVNIKTNLIEVEKKLYLEYVYLSEEEYKKLITKFGEKDAQVWIEKANNWIAEAPNAKNRKEKTSHYHMILNWNNSKDKKSFNNSNNQQKQPQYRDLSSIKFE